MTFRVILAHHQTMKGGAVFMEAMKIPSILKAYPNSFVVAQAVQRTHTGAVKLANVLKVHQTKEDAFANQLALELVGIKSFLIPTMETENALSVSMALDGDIEVKPLFSPSEYAKMYRDYFGWN